MKRCWLAIACVLVGSLAATAEEKPRRPAGDTPVMVVIELCEVEIDVLKLREMGIDWEKASHHDSVAANPAWLRKWAELLMENGLILRRSNPRLATVVGREAILDVGEIRETVKPRMTDGKLEVALTLETFDLVETKGRARTRGKRRESYSTVAPFKPGETKLLRHIPATNKDSEGKVTGETATLTFLTVDTVKPEVVEAAEGKPVESRIVELRPLDTELRAGAKETVAEPKRVTAPRLR